MENPKSSNSLKDQIARLENATERTVIHIPDADIPPTVLAPVTTVVGNQSKLKAKLAQFVSQPIKPYTAVDAIDKMHVVQPRLGMTEDWIDNQMEQLDCVFLRRMEDQELFYLGKKTFEEINTGVSLRTVASIMALSYNLKDATNQYVIFDCYPDVKQLGDNKGPDEFDGTPLRINTTGRHLQILANIADEEYLSKVSRSFCYIAASMLRMFTKSAENYSKVENHLKDKFKNFFSFDLAIDGFFPDTDTAKTIKSCFELHDVFKYTLYAILYGSNKAASKGANMKSFLYDIHLSFTGLHSFMLFSKAMADYNITNVSLAKKMYSKKIETELTAIATMFNKLYAGAEATYGLRMWRYGRIFNSNFMSVLQTKNCVFFTLVLAYLVKNKSPNEYQNVMNIAQLQHASKVEKIVANAYAMRVQHMIDVEKYEGNFSGVEMLKLLELENPEADV
ncbi:TPA_asm: nucleocapsid protein [Caladenia virus 1]|uniref:Nucleoprotein n=1 Tax=Caladenia virus 1 TaxID=2977961 RepID=A0A9N6YJ15_9RHAB|nr:TPA_asm: nucleocapsid protein [Caladenia virus 1]